MMTRKFAIVLLALVLFAAGQWIATDAAERATSRQLAPSNSDVVAQEPKSNGAPSPLKLLKVEPVKGYSGDSFTVTGEGFPANKKVEVLWSTVDAAYVTKVLTDNLEYHERKYDEKRVNIGSASADARHIPAPSP